MPLVTMAGAGSRLYVAPSSDTTAPTLSSAVGTNTGSTTATVGATTNEANGTLYVVVTTSAAQPSIAQIKAGQNDGGTSAAYASSQSISSTGAKTFSATGLTTSTTYYAHMVHTDAAANDSNRLSSSSFVPSASGVFFQPDLGAFTTPSEIWEVNNNGAPTILQSVVTRPGGQSKAIRIAYDAEDDGVELYPADFPATKTLFTRFYMMLGSEWNHYWPVGLKTCRFFTNTDRRVVVGDPGEPGDVYASTKFLWQKYPGDGGDSTADHVWGNNHACNNMEVPTAYSGAVNFANGLPYIRAGYWYKCEIWMVMNSAVNATDGVLQTWVDDQLVFSNTAWPWMSTGSSNPGGQNRSVTVGGDGFTTMWFGGNISANGGFGAGGTLYRYEDGHYLSTTKDR